MGLQCALFSLFLIRCSAQITFLLIAACLLVIYTNPFLLIRLLSGFESCLPHYNSVDECVCADNSDEVVHVW